MTVLVQESTVNATAGNRIDDGEPYEPWFEITLPIGRDVFRRLTKEYGRCAGKVWIDRPGGEPQHVGYVFQKSARYTDCDDTYLHETWVTFHTAPPERRTELHYANLGGKR